MSSFKELYQTIAYKNLVEWGYDEEFAKSLSENIKTSENLEEVLEPYRPKKNRRWEHKPPMDSAFREEIALREELRQEALRNYE